MGILYGFVFLLYFSVALLLLWFCSVPKNWDRMKKRWYITRFPQFFHRFCKNIQTVKINVVCRIDVKVEKNINKRDNGFDLDINLLLGK